MVPLGEPEAAIRPPAQRVGVLVRVARAETAEDRRASVGFAVRIAIRQVHELGALDDVESAAGLDRGELEAERHRQTLREPPRLVRLPVAVGILEHEDEIPAMLAGLQLRVGRRARDPEPAALVPADLHRADHAEGLVGEEVDLEAGSHLETRQLLGRRRRGRVGAQRQGRRIGRRRPVGDEGADDRIGVRQPRLVLPELIHEARVAGRALGERLRGAVAVGEGPVHAAPGIEPQAVLFHDRRAQGLAGLTRPVLEPIRDGRADEAGARRREVQPVSRERLTRGRLEPKQVDVHEAVAPGDGLGGAREPDQTRVQSGVVAHPRVQGFLEGGRSEDDDARRHLRELQQQFLVSLGERLRRTRRVQRFHLPEPGDHGRGAGAAQVFLPGAPRHHPVLPEHRVPLPAQVAELRRVRPEPGGQQALQRAGVLLDDHVLRAREHHDVLRVGAEPSVRERGGAGAGRDPVGHPAQRPVRCRRGGGFRRVRQDLESEILERGAPGAARRQLQRDHATGPARTFLLVVLHRDPVNPGPQAPALGPDPVRVPVAGLRHAVQFGFVRVGDQAALRPFLVEATVQPRPDVDLPPEDALARFHRAAEEEARPHPAQRARLEGQVEILQLPVGAQPAVARLRHAVAHQGAVLDGPGSGGLAAPAGQVAAVEERAIDGRGARGGRRRRGRVRRVRQFLEHDVLVADHRESIAMDLHRDLAAQRDRRIGLDVVDGLDAVEPDPDARAFGPYPVGVPLAGGLERLRLRRGVGLGEETVAPAFVIEPAVVARPEVGLIPDHLMVRRHPPGT